MIGKRIIPLGKTIIALFLFAISTFDFIVVGPINSF